MMTSPENDPMVHEVPTHVEAEDKLFLGLTVFQVLGVIMSIAVAYAGFGSSWASWIPWMPRAVICGIAVCVAIALLVVRIGNRMLPLALMDLLQYRTSPRTMSGSMSDLRVSDVQEVSTAQQNPLMALKQRLMGGGS